MRTAVITETRVVSSLVLITDRASVCSQKPLARDRLRGSPLYAIGIASGGLNEAEAYGSKRAALSRQAGSLCGVLDLIKIVKPGFIEVIMVPSPGGAHCPSR